jgi:hyperosmotically inducible protein
MTRQKLLGWLGIAALSAMTTVACAQSDPGITTAVKTKLATDDTVKAYKIDVDTKDRVVTLKGEVDSEAAHSRAIEIAKATDGVRDVVDSMIVARAVPTTGSADADRDKKGEGIGDKMSDAGITAAIKTKMLADTAVSGLKIDVDTANGVVTLTGNVKSNVERRRAVQIARETDGVKSVKDNLKIAKS